MGVSENRDPLVISLASNATFDTLRTHIREVFGNAPDGFIGLHAHLDIGERDLDLFDLRRLVHLLKDEFQVHVVGLRSTRAAVHRFAERELKLKVTVPEPKPAPAPSPAPSASLPVEPPPPVDPDTDEIPLASTDGQPTHPADERVCNVRKTLRSGAVIRYGGDVIVYGDVNPGAQVIAGGSILVMGALKGMAHAGARGNDQSFILGFDFRPTQLRIGSTIAIPPDNTADRTGRGMMPEIAFIRDNLIVIEPYRGRLPRSNS